jgi:hypothetical protein
MVTFSQCMRGHGVPGFPEPVDGRIVVRPGSGLSPGSPQFEAATEACRRLMPGAGPKGSAETPAERQHRAAGLLSFARCMRSHGVPSFPDPTGAGELSISAVKAAGVDVHAPGVQAAASTCLPAADGVLSAADVKRAESGGS